MELRDLPSVDRLLADEALAAAPRSLATAAARAALDRAREAIAAGADPGDVAVAARAELERLQAPSLRRVLNATGVIVHTNLGRAPLAPSAARRVAELGGSYYQPRARPRLGCARLAAGPCRRRSFGG